MLEFLHFLSSTPGYYAVSFWLECEHYRDTIASIRESNDPVQIELRNRLFKYAMPTPMLTLWYDMK